MASSKHSPGPHDRKIVLDAQGVPVPKPKCITLTKTTRKRCRRDAVAPHKLCKTHRALAEAERLRLLANPDGADPNEADDDRPNVGLGGTVPDPGAMGTKGGVTRSVMTQHAKLTKAQQQPNLPSTSKTSTFVISQQAAAVLRRIGQPLQVNMDPRQTLLDAVASAWRQAQVWEQMLASVPDEDWAMIGVTPVPGSQMSAKGARIEAIQKFLGEATKSAARISKLAIDAGIEERLVRLAEEQSAMIADTVKAGVIAAVKALVLSLHLTPANERVALDAALGSAATHLRLLATGAEQSDAVDESASPHTTIEGQATHIDRPTTPPTSAPRRTTERL